jgi:hypothetical protein
MTVDPRLRLAVDASRAWYDDVFALHGIPVSASRTLWRALADPPPYHSTVKTLEPSVDADEVLQAVASFGHCAVADSFGDLELPGFTVLIEASWLHHPGRPAGPMPAAWSVVSQPEALRRWAELHDYVGVLPDAALEHPRFEVLGRFEDGDLLGGAVLHDSGPAVELSNTWASGAGVLDVAELLAVAGALRPGRRITGYASREELTALVDGGFTEVGPQVVHVR